MITVEITPADKKITSVTCKPGEESSFQFLLLNTSANKADIGLDLLEESDWMTVRQEPNEKQFERTLQAKEDSAKRDQTTITIEIKPPADLLDESNDSTQYQFKLRAYDRDDYNQVFESDYVSITVERPMTEKGFLGRLFGGKKDKDKEDKENKE